MAGLLIEHLHWCAMRGLRPRTIEERRYELLRLERAIGVGIEDADEPTLRAWYHSLTCGASARSSALTSTREFYRWLVLNDYRPDDPTRRLIAPKVPVGRPRPISEDALAFALAFASERAKPMLFLAAYCGLRCGEIARLRGQDRVGDLLRVDGKGGKIRVVGVHPIVAEHVEFPESGPLFTLEDGAPIKPHRVSQLGNRELHRLGIPETMHQLRHRFGTRLWQVSKDLRMVQDLMGHASPATAAIYTAWDDSRFAEVVAAI